MGGLKYVFGRDIRSLLENANIEGVTKETYVDIVKEGETFILIYAYEQ